MLNRPFLVEQNHLLANLKVDERFEALMNRADSLRDEIM